MSSFDIITEIENQGNQIELSLAVLDEISDYFVFQKDFESLPHYAEHISDLLNVATILLRETTPKIGEAVKALMEKHKEETRGKAD